MPQRDAEALAGAVQFDCVDRGTHVNSIMTSGDYHAGAAFNSHPPAAQTWVDCVIGTSKLAGSDGQFVYMGGYQQGIGTLIAPFSAGVVCLLQYAGGRDKYGPAWYRVGSINVGGTGSNNGIPLLVQGLSFDPTRRLDFVDVKSIATGADCKRAIRLDSTSGPIGMVNIGASVIAAADPNYSGIELICGAGGYSLGRLRLADSYISTVSTTKPVVSVSTAGVTIPEVNLTNCTLAGGSYGLTGASARFSLTGQVKILNPATAPYSMDAASYVEIFGGSPADRWAPSASGSYQLGVEDRSRALGRRFHAHVSAAGRLLCRPGIRRGDARQRRTPCRRGPRRAARPLPACRPRSTPQRGRARFDGVSAWSRIGSEVAAAIPGNTPGAVMGFHASRQRGLGGSNLPVWSRVGRPASRPPARIGPRTPGVTSPAISTPGRSAPRTRGSTSPAATAARPPSPSTFTPTQRRSMPAAPPARERRGADRRHHPCVGPAAAMTAPGGQPRPDPAFMPPRPGPAAPTAPRSNSSPPRAAAPR